MLIVRNQVKWLQRRVGRVATMDGLALVADDDILHDPPDQIVEDGHAEQGKAISPGNEDRSENDQGDAGPAVEVFLEVELPVIAGSATVDDHFGRRSGCCARCPARLARRRGLAGFSSEARITVRAEEVEAGHGEGESRDILPASCVED